MKRNTTTYHLVQFVIAMQEFIFTICQIIKISYYWFFQLFESFARKLIFATHVWGNLAPLCIIYENSLMCACGKFVFTVYRCPGIKHRAWGLSLIILFMFAAIQAHKNNFNTQTSHNEWNSVDTLARFSSKNNLHFLISIHYVYWFAVIHKEIEEMSHSVIMTIWYC